MLVVVDVRPRRSRDAQELLAVERRLRDEPEGRGREVEKLVTVLAVQVHAVGTDGVGFAPGGDERSVGLEDEGARTAGVVDVDAPGGVFDDAVRRPESVSVREPGPVGVHAVAVGGAANLDFAHRRDSPC